MMSMKTFGTNKNFDRCNSRLSSGHLNVRIPKRRLDMRRKNAHYALLCK